MENQVSVSIKEGIGRETGKPWKGLIVKVGDWSSLVFPKSTFEMEYIEGILAAEAAKVTVNSK